MTARQPTITEAFADAAKQFPHATAISYRGRTVSYAELDERSNKLAHWILARFGDLLSRQSTPMIPLCLPSGIERIEVTLAILKCGAAYVPIDPDLPPPRIRFLLEDTQARLLITDAKLEAQMDTVAGGLRLPLKIAGLEHAAPEIAAKSAEALPVTNEPDDLCYVMYTSGSTGKPKGVLIPHRGVTRLVLDTDYIDIRQTDRFSQLSNFAFDAATFEVWGALLNGAEVVVLDKKTALSPQLLRDAIESSGIAVMFLTTALFNQVVVADPGTFASLRRLLFGGEAASITAVRSLLDSGLGPQHLANVYGPTENTTFSTCFPIRDIPEVGQSLPIGTAIASSSCILADEPDGELLVGGAGLALGYLNRPDLTAERFVAHPDDPTVTVYRTGDMVRRLDDGNLVFMGRVDNQVKIRGFRIELEEIEFVLSSHEAIQTACVATTERDEDAHQELIAYIQPSDPESIPPPSAIRAFVRTRLPAYMAPTRFYRVDEIPLSPTGKVDRRTLPELNLIPLDEPRVSNPPTTDIEFYLRDLWSTILRVPKEDIGIADSFFEHGGDSLLSIALLGRIEQDGGRTISAQSFFEDPTIRQLARSLDESTEETEDDRPKAGEAVRSGSTRHPLTPYQRQIWLHQQIAPEAPVYNEPLSITMPETIDADALRNALVFMMDRHEALRARFSLSDAGPVQWFPPLAERARESIGYFDLRHLPSSRAEGEALVIGRRQASRPFDLRRESPIRFTLVQLRDDLFRLYLVAHHLVIDGVAIYNVFLPELEQAYRAYAGSRQPNLPDLEFGFADYAEWHHRQSQASPREEAYWRDKLKGFERLLMSTDGVADSSATLSGDTLTMAIPRDLTLQVKALARDQATTPFVILLTAFKVLLFRYTMQRDVTVASVTANRGLPGLGKIVGDFVNVLLLRSQLPAGGSFLEAIDVVRTTSLEAVANQNIPFERVVRTALDHGAASGGMPVEVAFVMEPALENQTSGWELSQLDVHTGTAKFHLTMELDEREEGVVGRVEYRTEIFEASTIERFVDDYLEIIRAAVERPSSAYERMSLLSAEDRRKVLVEWNDNVVEYGGPDCLHQLVEWQVDLLPDQPAIVIDDDSITYAELDKRANQIAHALIERGAGPEEIVAVWTDRGIDHIVSLLGVLKAGAAYVPVGANDPPDRVEFIIADTQATTLVCDAAHVGLPPSSVEYVVVIDNPDGDVAGKPENRPDVAVSPANLAYVIYTSGSTGRPKGVMIEHGQIVDRTNWASAALRLTPSDTYLHLFSLAFDASTTPTWWSLARGATISMPSNEGILDPDHLSRQVIEHEVTTICATPSMMAPLLDAIAGTGYQGLRLLMTGGESLSADLLDRMNSMAPRVFNLYGPTEGTVLATAWEARGEAARRPPIGIAVANTSLYVLDANEQPLPIGVPGELHIGGLGVARGYLNRPEETEARFIADPFARRPGARLYKTGDVARFLPSGDIDFVSRVDDQVKIRGHRVEPGEIEEVLRGHEAVSNCAVIARRRSAGSTRLLAYYVCNPDTPDPGVPALREHVSRTLPEHMVPAGFQRVEAIPLTPNGKVDPSALPEPETAVDPSSARVEPRSQTEKQLAEIWAGLLDHDIGIHDDFFECGADSLMMLHVITRARQQGLDLEMSDLLENRTIAKLAGKISAESDAFRYASSMPRMVTVFGSPPAANHQVAAADLGRTSAARLIELQRGQGRPLFLVHPAGGSAVCYRHLAGALGDRTVYGLNAGQQDQAIDSIESVAAAYLSEILEIQSDGPYLLGGWSFGGVVAFEMARQLETSGERVPRLILVDSYLPTEPAAREELIRTRDDPTWLLAAAAGDLGRLFGVTLPSVTENVATASGGDPAGRLSEWLVETGRVDADLAREFVEAFVGSYLRAAGLLLNYAPGVCEANILLVRAAGRDARLTGESWSEHTRGFVDPRTVPGNHQDLVFPPYVNRVAAELTSILPSDTDVDSVLFKGWRVADWKIFLSQLPVLHFKPGDVILREGESGQTMLLVSEGELEVFVDQDGQRIQLNLLGPDTVVGELGFLDGRPRTASIGALTAGTAYVMSRQTFTRLARDHPDLSITLLSEIARIVSLRFRRAQGWATRLVAEKN